MLKYFFISQRSKYGNWQGLDSSGGAAQLPLERDHLQRPDGQPSLQIIGFLR